MKEENLMTPNSIRTFTGRYVDVLNPTPEMIDIEDIAHALAHQCRFGGHTPDFYSVAQHSVECVKKAGKFANSIQLAVLMHDASEAYLCDIPRPIKPLLKGYKELEDNLMSVIAEKYGFYWPMTSVVKEIDNNMLQFEWDNMIIEDNLCAWDQIFAKQAFLKHFAYLCSK